MTGLRIVDRSGAAWPITGGRCLICRMPLDPAVTDHRHPGCGSAPPLTGDAYRRLVGHLTQALGAAEMASTTTTKEIA